jgi:hypothetical protein
VTAKGHSFATKLTPTLDLLGETCDYISLGVKRRTTSGKQKPDPPVLKALSSGPMHGRGAGQRIQQAAVAEVLQAT